MQFLGKSALGASILAILSVACSSVLGVDFNRVVLTDDAFTEGGPTTAAEPTSPAVDGKCEGGRRLCSGLCVTSTDPKYGCGSDSCKACSIANGTASCRDGTCAVLKCAPGRGDCDGRAETGCETDTTSAHHDCGACGKACGASEVCDRGTCAATCSDGLTNCGGSCVALSSSADNCSACGRACPGLPNGASTCKDSKCGATCNDGFHDCGGQCLDNGSVYSCGSACSPCNLVPNGASTCDLHACGVRCNQGFHTCNGQCAADGDVGSCGASCTPCVAPANGSATCDGVRCGFTCDMGYRPSGNGCTANAKTVFLSSNGYSGNLGGLAGADATCQHLAQGAGLTGTFKAWLSDETTDARDRFAHATVPYHLRDGTIIADNFTDLADGSIQHPIDMDERGRVVLGDGGFGFPLRPYTATHQNGTKIPGYTCNNWTATSGQTRGGYAATAYDESWSDNEPATGLISHCDNADPLYCFEQ